MGSNAHLSIGTATDRINLLNPGGFHENGWRPRETPIADYYSESALADFRSLTHYKHENATETIPLLLGTETQNDAILQLQRLRKMLLKARDYWATNWQNEIVYIAAQQSCETERRFAWIQRGELPEDDVAFAHLFKDGKMRNLTLVVERGPWLDNPPGTGTCVPASAYGYYEERGFGIGGAGGGPVGDGLYYLHFTADDDVMNCGSDASVDNLPNANFCVDGWVRCFSDGGGGWGRIWDKGTVYSKRWRLTVRPGGRLDAWVNFATTDARSVSTERIDDGEWHYVRMNYNASIKRCYLYIDNAQVGYSTLQDGVGSYTSDAANDLLVGNSDSPADERAWDGDFGWMRIGTTHRFDMPERCSCPTVDGGTIGLWCMSEGTGTTVDNAEGTAALDGDLADEGTPTWGFDCYYEGEDLEGETSCIDPVFVGNHQKTSNLTHIYHYDQSTGTWSGNLLDAALPYNLLPATPQILDAVHFGIENTGTADDGGPFSSLIFNIGQAASGLTSTSWTYWDGVGWVLGLDDRDNTAGAIHAFQEEGINGVHWTQPSDWVTGNLNAIYGGAAPNVTAYWVKLGITGAPSSPVPPQQQTRNPYTVSWAFMELDESQASGDMPILAKTNMLNQSSVVGLREWQRAIIGARRTDRGENFVAYLNACQEQNPLGVDVQAITATGGVGGFDTLTSAPTGRVLYMQNGDWAMQDVLYPAGYIDILPPLTRQYRGKFRVILRAMQYDAGTAAAGDIGIQLVIYTGFNYVMSNEFTFPLLDTLYAFDMGEYSLPLGIDMDSLDYVSNIRISLWTTCYDVANSNDLYWFDVALIPTDEWCIDLAQSVTETAHNNFIEIDSIDHPKSSLRVFLRETPSNYILANVGKVSPGPFTFNHTGSQKLWFAIMNSEAMPSDAGHEIVNRMELYLQKRYTSMRGEA